MPTSHRGFLLIHAALKQDAPVIDDLAAWFTESYLGRVPTMNAAGKPQLGIRIPTHYTTYGAILGLVNVIDCQPVNSKPMSDYWFSRHHDHETDERMMGDWSEGRYAWRMSAVTVLFPEPIPCRGQQGLWTPDAEVTKACGEQLMKSDYPFGTVPDTLFNQPA
jgi:hypothetical protein